jgi:hypothetical protein
MALRICYVTYWGLSEGLTQATVLPHLRILSRMKEVDQIDFFSIERNRVLKQQYTLDKLHHHPFYSSHGLKSKLTDNYKFKRFVKSVYDNRLPDLIMARSSMAGWMIQSLAFKSNIPLCVESYEPHAAYMLEEKIWKKSSMKYKMLDRAERAQKLKAKFILPITQTYKNYLQQNEGVHDSRMMHMPCCVDFENFKYDHLDREKLRDYLSLKDEKLVGIYTGKYGGIYLKEEAIELFLTAKSFYKKRFFLIILSPQKEEWSARLQEAGFEMSEFFIGFVSQSEVPQYLSASDYAFSLHRPTPSKMAISPIKNAEFWANGLPIIMPDRIGDDSKQTKMSRLGVVVDDFSELSESVFESLEPLLEEDRLENDRVRFAKEHRGFDIVEKCYTKILASIST